MPEKMSDFDDRYLNDPMFHHLVDSLMQLIDKCQFTPSEIRGAAVYAASRYEMLFKKEVGLCTETPEDDEEDGGKCDACNGTGLVADTPGHEPWDQWADTPQVKNGLVNSLTCRKCGGRWVWGARVRDKEMIDSNRNGFA